MGIENIGWYKWENEDPIWPL